MDLVSGMLIDLMATMARIDQEKRVARIRKDMDYKRAAEPKWRPTDKGRDVTRWETVQRLMEKHSKMSADDVATLAKCSIATVYCIRPKLSVAQRLPG